VLKASVALRPLLQMHAMLWLWLCEVARLSLQDTLPYCQ